MISPCTRRHLFLEDQVVLEDMEATYMLGLVVLLGQYNLVPHRVPLAPLVLAFHQIHLSRAFQLHLAIHFVQAFQLVLVPHHFHPFHRFLVGLGSLVLLVFLEDLLLQVSLAVQVHLLVLGIRLDPYNHLIHLVQEDQVGQVGQVYQEDRGRDRAAEVLVVFQFHNQRDR